MKNNTSKKQLAVTAPKTPAGPIDPTPKPVPAAAQRSKESRNKANTIRNSAKVEHYLTEVEKAQGFAKSWALRERLEQGHVSLDELMRR